MFYVMMDTFLAAVRTYERTPHPSYTPCMIIQNRRSIGKGRQAVGAFGIDSGRFQVDFQILAGVEPRGMKR